MMEATLQEALLFLKQNEEQNAYLIDRLLQGGIGTCFFAPDGVCLWDEQHNKYLYAVISETAMEPLFTQVQAFRPRKPGDEQVSLITSAPLAEAFFQQHPELSQSLCVQFEATVPCPTPAPNPDIEIRPLTADLFPWVLSVYEHPELSLSFLAKRCQEKPAFAAFLNNRPVGFFLTHSAAELGPVYVDSTCRGKGIAQLLYARMLASLDTPAQAVLFVLTHNLASQTYLQRMGCPKAPESLVWFWFGS